MSKSGDHYRNFLEFVLSHVANPAVTVAAGHAASYALAQAIDTPSSAGRLCLLAPTWRGPLPTMTGRRPSLFKNLNTAVDLAFVGPLLYRLNVNDPMIGMMTRGHVYTDPAWLTPERMAAKRAVTEAPGARHASFRFVTGALDLFTERAAFLNAASHVSGDILVCYGAQTPRKSKAEMSALGALPNVQATILEMGKLAFYEEFPRETAEKIIDALGRPKA